MLKLSHRLNTLSQLVIDDYAHIWDCCCDHGHLGMSLLAKFAERPQQPQVHFVDIVPSLVQQVEETLKQHYADFSDSWHTHCLDVSKLPLLKTQKKQLIIIAGIGGDLMTEMIGAINNSYPEAALDFLLCPVNQTYQLRQQLTTYKFELIDEVLITENKRFYEVLFVTKGTGISISKTGDKMWQLSTDNHSQIARDYLTKTINHYRRVALQDHNAQMIVTAYQDIKLPTSPAPTFLR